MNRFKLRKFNDANYINQIFEFYCSDPLLETFGRMDDPERRSMCE